MSGSLWVCLLWSVGASDVVSVWGRWIAWALPVALVVLALPVGGVGMSNEQSGCGNSVGMSVVVCGCL